MICAYAAIAANAFRHIDIAHLDKDEVALLRDRPVFEYDN
jgi:hypothetical protein